MDLRQPAGTKVGIVFCLLLVGIVLSACSTIPDQAFQTAEIKPVEGGCLASNGRRTWKDDECKAHKATRRIPVEVAWLEYDEHGDPLVPAQRDAILKWQADHPDGEVLVYIHGWHHNASTTGPHPSSNALQFPELMLRYINDIQLKRYAELSPHPQQSDPPLPSPSVLGIYVGWRGERFATQGTPWWFLSIDGRSDIADAIGTHGRLKQDLQQFAGHIGQGHMLVIGHSLGGRILTRAFEADLTSAGKPDASGIIHPFRPLGDRALIATINAAVGADCYDDDFAAPTGIPTGERPYWLNITSQDDQATNSIWSTARFLGLINACHHDSPAASTAVGHYAPYIGSTLYKDGPICEEEHDCVGMNPVRQMMLNLRDDLWYCGASTSYLGFRERDQDTSIPYNLMPAVYRLDYSALHQHSSPGAVPAIWNIQTSHDLIGFRDKEGQLAGDHDGFIDSILVRVLFDALFLERCPATH